MVNGEKGFDTNEVVEKYNIDIKELEEEQIKLSKTLVLKDSIDFSSVERISGIDSVFYKNKIISAIVVLEQDEIIEQEYFDDRLKFPYIPGFRAYRELPAMISAFNKLDVKPEVVFLRGHGILHPRGLGIASHFSIACNVPTIGIADSLIIGEAKDSGKSDDSQILSPKKLAQDDDIFLNGKLKGRILKTKEGANPIYISPGNLISLETAVKLVKRFTIEPHKLPEPLRLARKYAKEVLEEGFSI